MQRKLPSSPIITYLLPLDLWLKEKQKKKRYIIFNKDSILSMNLGLLLCLLMLDSKNKIKFKKRWNSYQQSITTTTIIIKIMIIIIKVIIITWLHEWMLFTQTRICIVNRYDNQRIVTRLEDLEIWGRMETIQTTTLLILARIQRRILETWRDLLTLKLQRKKPSANTRMKNS